MIQKELEKRERGKDRGGVNKQAFTWTPHPGRTSHEKMPIELGSDWKKELAPMDFLPPAGKWPV